MQGCGVWGVGFQLRDLGCGVSGFGFRVSNFEIVRDQAGCRKGFWFGVWSLEFGVHAGRVDIVRDTFRVSTFRIIRDQASFRKGFGSSWVWGLQIVFGRGWVWGLEYAGRVVDPDSRPNIEPLPEPCLVPNLFLV